MNNQSAPSRGHDLRAVLIILAIVLTVAATIWLGELSDEVPLLREAHGRWQGIGFVLFSLLATAVPIGTLLHSFWARSAGRSVPLGWCNAALVMAYGALIAWLAWQIGPNVSPDFGSGRGGGSKGSYVFWLICVLPALAVVACAGALFPRVKAAASAEVPAETGVGDGDPVPPRPRKFYQVVLVTAGIGWAVGALPFLLLVLVEATASQRS